MQQPQKQNQHLKGKIKKAINTKIFESKKSEEFNDADLYQIHIN